MRVKRTLSQVYEELKELLEDEATYARIIARSLIEGDNERVEHFTQEYKHIKEVISYMLQIEVEYEDKYEEEEEDE